MADPDAVDRGNPELAGDEQRPWRRGGFLIEAGFLALLLVPLLLISLEYRLPELDRPFWEDEIHHNYSILRSGSIKDLRWSISAQLQPALDYALRKVFWFNTLGHEELHLRLPSLFASLGTVIAVFLGAYAYLRRPRGQAVAAALAFSLGCWVAINPGEINLAAEARHYSFVAFVSVLWATTLLFPPQRTAWPLVATSAAFLNTHFFSLPFVTAALPLSRFSAAKRGSAPMIAKMAGLAALLVVATIALNAPAFRWLATSPPAAVDDLDWARVVEALRETASLWQQLDSYLALPVPFLLLGLAMAGLAVAGIERRNALVLLALAFVLLPVWLAYLRFRSAYGFGPRYFTPYLGLGFAVLLTVISGSIVVFSRLANGRRWAVTAGATALAAGLLLLVGVPRAIVQAPGLSALRLPPPNFSPYFQLYSKLRATHRPLFVLHTHCWANDIPLLYLRYVGGEPYRSGYEVADSKGCETKAEQTHAALRSFLQMHPRGLIVLDDKQRECLPTGKVLSVGSARADQVDQSRCVWAISDAASIDEVRAIAEAVGFVTVDGVF